MATKTVSTTTPPVATDLVEAEALALLPVPVPAAAVDAREQGIQFQNLIHAARRTKMIGFGLHGSLMGAVERVGYERLWLNPASPMVYTDEEVWAMGQSLARQQQLHPLVVAPFADPRTREQGGTGADLLIIDGGLRSLSAPRAGMDALNVIVRPLPTFYAAVLETATAKISQRPLTDLEAGRFCRRLLTIHRLLREQG